MTTTHKQREEEKQAKEEYAEAVEELAAVEAWAKEGDGGFRIPEGPYTDPYSV